MAAVLDVPFFSSLLFFFSSLFFLSFFPHLLLESESKSNFFVDLQWMVIFYNGYISRGLNVFTHKQYHIRHGLPYWALVASHLSETLIFIPVMLGILLFLMEFFRDQLLAFLVLSVVWLCEAYGVICVRTATSLHYFPKIYFYYFCLFYIYHFSYAPLGFSYMALLCTVLFIQVLNQLLSFFFSFFLL